MIDVLATRSADVFLQGAAGSLNRPRRLDVRDGAGRLVTQWEILRDITYFRLPVHVEPGWNRFYFRVTPGMEERAPPGDTRRVSVAFSPLNVVPIDPELAERSGGSC